MSTNYSSNERKEAGSAVRHLVLLLAVAAGCYFGVKWLYQKIDAELLGKPDLPLAVGETDKRVEQVQAREAIEADKEAIVRRNVFLSKTTEESTDYSDDLLKNLKPSEADLILVGTIIDADGDNRAVIFNVAQKKQGLVREGDVINGSSIRQILPGKVIISRQGRNEMLDIAAAAKLRSSRKDLAVPVQSLQASEDEEPVDADENSENENQSTVEIDLDQVGKTSEGPVIKGRINKDI